MKRVNGLSQQLCIGESLRLAVNIQPEQEAFVFGERSLTFRALLDRSIHLAGWLQGKGMESGDKIACMSKNNLAFIELYFASSLSGTVFVPLNFRLASNEIQYILEHCDARLLFVEEEFLDLILSIREQLPNMEDIVVIGGELEEAYNRFIRYEDLYRMETAFEEAETLTDDDPHVIVYTSGTTGRPKGAVLTHKNFYMNGMNKIYENKQNKWKKSLVVTPLFHQAALSGLMQICLTNNTMHIHREFNPSKILQTIETQGINSMFMAPSMWSMLLQVPNSSSYDLSSMEYCILGSAITPAAMKKEIISFFCNARIFEAFGQTEMSPSTTYLLPEDSLRKTESVGRPSVNVRVRIVDDEMNDVQIGEVGEIIYRGPTVMKEYYKDPEATAEAFKGGWFHSGDLVRSDEEGFIYVVDRKKDMIITGGENVYSAEVEEVLFNHPGIAEAAVIGLPDVVWGERVKAYVVAKPGHPLTEEDIIEYCRIHLASYKKPQMVEFVQELPRNAAGKVLKNILRTN